MKIVKIDGFNFALASEIDEATAREFAMIGAISTLPSYHEAGDKVTYSGQVFHFVKEIDRNEYEELVRASGLLMYLNTPTGTKFWRVSTD